MFDHLADPDPPTDTTTIRQHVERRLRNRRRRRVGGGLAVGSALAIAAVVGVVLNTTGSGVQVTTVSGTPGAAGGRGAATASFLTVEEPGSRGVGNIELQERSLSDGKLEAVLLRYPSVHDMVASFEPDGNVLAAVQTSQCGGRLYSINPATGAVKAAGSLSNSIAVLSGLSVSSNGKYVAYEAYPGCEQGTPTSTTTVAPHGPPVSTPTGQFTYVAVRSLTTGATAQVPLGYQGDVPGEDPVWSPDGTQLAIVSPKNGSDVLILSTAHPDLRTARSVKFSPDCDINAIGAWTAAGITTSLSCNGTPNNTSTETSVLEQIEPTGKVTFRQPLPACLGVNSIESSLPGSAAIVDAIKPPTAFVGHGCTAPDTLLSEYDRGHFRTILSLRSIFLTMPD